MNIVEKFNLALQCPSSELERRLLEVDYDGWTPLHHACYRGNAGVVEAVLEKINCKEIMSKVVGVREYTRLHSLLHLATIGSCALEVSCGGSLFSLLAESQLENNSSHCNAYRIIKILLKNGATISRNKDGYSPIDYLVSNKVMKIDPTKNESANFHQSKCLSLMWDAIKTLSSRCAAESLCVNKSFVTLLSPSNADQKTSPLVRWSRCQFVWYCGRECQKADWQRGGHKQKCIEKSSTMPAEIPTGINMRTGAIKSF